MEFKMKLVRTKKDILGYLEQLGFKWPVGYTHATVSSTLDKVFLFTKKPERVDGEWKNPLMEVVLDRNGSTFSVVGHHSTTIHTIEYKHKVLEEGSISFDLKVAKSYVNKSKSSAERGLTFSLSLDFFVNLFKDPVCAYTGVELSIPTDSALKPLDLTLERIDPLVGYTESNTIVVSRHANSTKAILDSFLHSDLPDEAKRKILSQALYRVNKRIKGSKVND